MNFHSNGKLMLTGEYLALDNALVLTLPTKYGQSLKVKTKKGKGLINWKSYTNENKVWFKAILKFDNNTFNSVANSDNKVLETLIKILNSANKLSKLQFSDELDFNVSTHLDFPQDWGLGSSSTLINNIAQWFKIDPFQLHFSVFNGSGYDIASAYSNSPVTFQINNKKPIVNQVSFNPIFKNLLYFVHLNQKQNSYNEVKKYQKNKNQATINTAVKEVNNITNSLLKTTKLKEFERLITEHESILASILNITPIQSNLFSDYKYGVIKSLGAWGGDFILVTGDEKSKLYFKNKGYQTIFSFKDMIL